MNKGPVSRERRPLDGLYNSPEVSIIVPRSRYHLPPGQASSFIAWGRYWDLVVRPQCL